ncbi:hypothetical protein ILUMI_23529 [Ignelater luminosus]|uniref:Tc1-like transposase DDE domain-containing protein n=1 Tax=Ignelater luminosus TaxID=2038154 RepID=A0A8K0FWW0_IGNLU|nr:hypothetical protein ILUMI_23529 [Ignelater luminosus]
MARGKCIDETNPLITIKLSKSGQSNSEIANLLDLFQYSVRNIVRKFKTTDGQRKNWTPQQWHAVQWSDESPFEVCVGDSRNRVIRKKQEAFHLDRLKETAKFPASVMVWGSMSAKGIGKLHFIIGTVDTNKYLQILEESLVPLMEKYLISGQDFIFHQEGAACHTSKQSLKWLDDYSILLLKWVSSSPDLSSIETLWHGMKKMLRKHPARTIPKLKQKLQEIWGLFTSKFCQDLINTMPQRISAVIKNITQ